jgi:hypothetical protein
MTMFIINMFWHWIITNESVSKMPTGINMSNVSYLKNPSNYYSKDWPSSKSPTKILPSPSSLRWIYYLRTTLKWGTGYFITFSPLISIHMLRFSPLHIITMPNPPSKGLWKPTLKNLLYQNQITYQAKKFLPPKVHITMQTVLCNQTLAVTVFKSKI